MKYPVWPSTKASEIPPEAKEIHLVRPLKNSVLEEIVSKKGIQKIFLSKSCLLRLSEKTRKMLEKKGIETQIEQKRGRPLDIDPQKVKELIELRNDYQSLRKIEKLTGVPKSTIHYLLKYALRQKIRNGNKIIYV